MAAENNTIKLDLVKAREILGNYYLSYSTGELIELPDDNLELYRFITMYHHDLRLRTIMEDVIRSSMITKPYRVGDDADIDADADDDDVDVDVNDDVDVDICYDGFYDWLNIFLHLF